MRLTLQQAMADLSGILKKGESYEQKAANTACTRPPTKSVGAVVVGVCAFSGTLCGLKLVPLKWRCLVPPTSTPKGHNAHRWAADSIEHLVK